jgi:hypothetical protein
MEGSSMRVSESRMLRKISRPKRGEVTGNWKQLGK